MSNTTKTYCHPATFALPTDTPNTLLGIGCKGHVSEANFLQGEAAMEYPAELITGAKHIGEHLDDFWLINMPARQSNCCSILYIFSFQINEGETMRIYDPSLGRFLSPDNHVQNPYNLQNYNRYSYCYNNPLKYFDPDGKTGLHLKVIF